MGLRTPFSEALGMAVEVFETFSPVKRVATGTNA